MTAEPELQGLEDEAPEQEPIEDITESEKEQPQGPTVEEPVSSWVPVGDSGLQIGLPMDEAKRADGTALPPTTIEVTILADNQLKKLGVSGVAIQLEVVDGDVTELPVEVRVPSSWVAGLYGADYQARVQWIQVSQNRGTGKVGTAPIQGVPEGDLSDDLGLESRVDGDGATVLSQKLGSGPVVVASFGAPISSNGTGDFTATDLKPSSNWDVSAQTGGFAWTYPMEAPPSPSGVQQSLYLEYTSQSVDGTTGSTNNQPSEVGDGWQLAGTGFIERTYVSCSKDDGASGPSRPRATCAGRPNNATLSLGGGPARRARHHHRYLETQADDGTRIEQLTGTAPRVCGERHLQHRVLAADHHRRHPVLLRPEPASPAGRPGMRRRSPMWTVPVFGNDAG